MLLFSSDFSYLQCIQWQSNSNFLPYLPRTLVSCPMYSMPKMFSSRVINIHISFSLRFINSIHFRIPKSHDHHLRLRRWWELWVWKLLLKLMRWYWLFNWKLTWFGWTTFVCCSKKLLRCFVCWLDCFLILLMSALPSTFCKRGGEFALAFLHCFEPVPGFCLCSSLVSRKIISHWSLCTAPTIEPHLDLSLFKSNFACRVYDKNHK